jgi:2-(1,2-epoxy-1,2-dihydrophenyl)acetyl-CoA isomerase
MVNRLVPNEQLPEKARQWAAELARGPVHTMGLAKRDFNRAVLRNLEQVLDYEAHIQEIAGKGADYKEGVQAFLEKRQPNFV